MKIKLLISALLTLVASACGQDQNSVIKSSEKAATAQKIHLTSPAYEKDQSRKSNPRFNIYKEVKLYADLSHLSSNQKEMIGLLIDASKIMDDLFWKQAYGDKQALLNSISDPQTRNFADINYGPWDRLDGDYGL